MITLYSDSLYPVKAAGSSTRFNGKTIGEILKTHPSPRRFIKSFNASNNKYCLSDEILVDHSKTIQVK